MLVLKSIRSFLLLIVFIFTLTKASGQIGGNATYKFLDLPASARIAALGGKMVAFKDNDVNLANFNPSAINPAMDKHLTMSTVAYFSGINFGYVGYGKDYGKLGTFVGGIQYINYGNFARTDVTGLKIGTFSAAETALQLGWGIQRDYMQYGANVKVITSFLESYSSYAAAIDLAATYEDPEKEFIATAVIRNIGFKMKSYTDNANDTSKLPFEIQIGISQKLEHLPLTLFLTAHNLQRFDIRYDDPNEESFIIIIDPDSTEKSYIADKIARHFIVGGEFAIKKNFKLRGAYNYFRRQELKLDTRGGSPGFSFGIGFNIKKIGIDYGLSSYSLAGTSHHFSITIKVDEVFQKKVKPNNGTL